MEPHLPILAQTSDGKTVKILAVRVSAGTRLPVLGLPVGPSPKGSADDVSATIDFLRPDNHEPFLPWTPGGLWADDGFDGLPEVSDDTPASVTLQPGEARLLLVAAKVEGDEKCYALDGSAHEGLLAPELGSDEHEGLVEITVAGRGTLAEGRYRLENPGWRLESFDLVRDLVPVRGFWRATAGVHDEITDWRNA